MERFLWAIVALLPIAFGVFVLRHTAAVVDTLYAKLKPDYHDETQPTFLEKRGIFDERDRGVQLAMFRSVGVGAIIVGVGMLVSLAIVSP
jgi:hypothetical protein